MTERFTEADVQLVAKALDADTWTSDLAAARAILSALAEAGRLRPDGLRERWQVQYLDKAFSERHAEFFDDRAEAGEALAMVRASPRYSDVKLLHRISTAWVEADEDGTTD